MINGEGTREISPAVASPDPFDEFPSYQLMKLDGGGGGGDASPASSRYSSCGESEFERYCSANSVLGTPSVCSSSNRIFNECVDSEFGSVRSSGIGEDGSLENFSSEGGFDRILGGSGSLGNRRIQGEGRINIEKRNILGLGKGLVMVKNTGSNLYDDDEDYSMLASSDMTMSGLLGYGNLGNFTDEGLYGDNNQEGFISHERQDKSETMLWSAENLPFQERDDGENGDEIISNSGVGNGSAGLLRNEEGLRSHVFTEEVGVCSDVINSESALQFDGTESGKWSEEEETLSRCEHSEDDSMVDYGTDNEHKTDANVKQNIQYHREDKIDRGSSLLMNSSIAFGSEDWDDFVQEMEECTLPPVMSKKVRERKMVDIKSEKSSPMNLPAIQIDFLDVGGSEQGEVVNEIALSNDRFQVTDESAVNLETYPATSRGCPHFGEPEQEEASDIPPAGNQVQGNYECAENQSFSGSNIFQTRPDSRVNHDPLSIGVNVQDSHIDTEHRYEFSGKVIGLDDNQVLESQELGKSESNLDPLSDNTVGQGCPSSTEDPIEKEATFFEDEKPNSLPLTIENNIQRILNGPSFSVDLFEEHPASIKTESVESNDSYEDVVHEMEEILLDSVDSPGFRFTQGNRMSQSYLTLPLRDGGSTASTSGIDDAYSLVQHPLRIDGVEVVGAKQKKGDVSLGERLVGVKEYTMYIIRVWSKNDQWEVERRYRDFFTLYRRLKSVFVDKGLVLPSPWSSVERESRKFFGCASPDVVAERSALIQECLRSILHSRNFSSPPSALILFLSPEDGLCSSPASNSLLSQSTFSTRGEDTENVSMLGKTISLVVDIRPDKSLRQLLEAQQYTCAGCHRNFDDGKTLMRDFVQSLGWGKPRLCEYTGQLYCSSCHTNDTAVLPARVLHRWDFTQYLISQLAKSYLDSIHDQPMLCVSAVNPFLFSKVPALHHVMNVRKKIGAMLPYVRCPFRRSINKGLGSRRYLLDGNDFFALRDLIDLSKGAFAALPVMIETLSKKILEHITEQCLICYDVGVPCGARQACTDPSSLLFPFQEGEVEKCKSCGSVFHQPCFRKLTDCHCGAHFRVNKEVGGAMAVSHRVSDEEGALDLMGRKLGSGIPVGFLSGIFSKSRQENRHGHKDGDNVILMGSLPSTSL